MEVQTELDSFIVETLSEYGADGSLEHQRDHPVVAGRPQKVLTKRQLDAYCAFLRTFCTSGNWFELGASSNGSFGRIVVTYDDISPWWGSPWQ
jgi:hypothetical protein